MTNELKQQQRMVEKQSQSLDQAAHDLSWKVTRIIHVVSKSIEQHGALNPTNDNSSDINRKLNEIKDMLSNV